MTKKIIAGVLALTLVMGSAALPSGVFENVAEKTGITASACGEKDEITSGDFKYGILNDGTVEIAKYMGSATALIIPTTLDGKKVTSIGESAFCGCTSLASITIPNSVTSIGICAFGNCTSLTSIVIPNSVTIIGYEAFRGCESLKSITIPDSVTSIEKEAFDNTAWYDNQADGVVYAGKFAYDYKGEMPANTSITLKSGTVGIVGSAFEHCLNLVNITVPSSVKNIGNSAFWCCTSLTSIVIPNSVTSIEFGAYLFSRKWKNSFVCPKCGGTHCCELSDGRYQCNKCHHQTTVTIGTVLHRSYIPLTYLISYCILSASL